MKIYWALSIALAGIVAAQAQPKTEEDIAREKAIAEFTQKMIALNYPSLFEAAATEFNVPPDVLKGVAFAETRWEQLTWPPGETASPETGMPRPFGIMSLWDNKYFGHSLVEGAELIGKTPDDLKLDAFQNMRAGAALLRKAYDENPKPSWASPNDIESWNYAIRKYCGIPEPDLSAQHALDVYVFMSQGYHQYGIEWPSNKVNLGPMRAETQQIVAAERAKKAAQLAAMEAQLPPPPATNQAPPKPSPSPQTSAPPVAVVSPPSPPAPVPASNRWWLLLLLAVVIGVVATVYAKRKRG